MAEILTLDDVLDATILVGKILKKKGHVVHTFTEEDEAIAFARHHPIDLAILDIKLKKMSGIEVLAILKKKIRSCAPSCSPATRLWRPPVRPSAWGLTSTASNRSTGWSWKKRWKRFWRQKPGRDRMV